MSRPSEWDAVVVGAGIAGLSAAQELVAAGKRVLVVDKVRGVGGRIATRRIGSAVCDHGAQFFTVRGRAFGGIVAEVQAAGAVVEWCRGFTREGSLGAATAQAGHPRWRGVRGMTDLPKQLAACVGAAGGGRCVVQLRTKVTAVVVEGGRVRLEIETGEGERNRVEAAGGIITAPVPQALELLAAGGVVAPAAIAEEPEAIKTLRMVSYDPCFALMLVLDSPSRVPPPGGIQFDPADGGPIAWLADNQRKGISPVPALTIHADAAFSRRHFADPPKEVAALLIHHARAWIEGDPSTAVVEKSLQRWKFALPTVIIPAPLVAVSTAPPIACCGDAFAGPRIEGAASSWLAAGRWLERALHAGS